MQVIGATIVSAVVMLASASSQASPAGAASAGADPAPAASVTEDETNEAGGGPELGWGFQRSLVGFTGPQVELHFDRLMLNGMLAARHVGVEGADSYLQLGVGVAGFYRLVGHDGRGALFAGGRLLLGYAGDAATPGNGSAVDVVVEIPARFQLWFGRHFAMHVEAGLLYARTGDDGNAFAGTLFGGSSRIAFGTGGLLGSLGFSVYWP